MHTQETMQSPRNAEEAECVWLWPAAICMHLMRCRLSAAASRTHVAVPAVHNKHIQRECVCGVENMRLTDIEPQITL